VSWISGFIGVETHLKAQ